MSLTKEDLALIRGIMQSELEPVKSELKADIKALDAKVTALDYRVAELDVRLTREIRVVALDVRELGERVQRLNVAFASHVGDEPNSLWQHKPSPSTKAN